MNLYKIIKKYQLFQEGKRHKLIEKTIFYIHKYFPIGSIRSRYARGSFWVILGTLISQGLTLIVFIILARILGQTQYGALGILLSSINTFSTLACLGLSTATTKFVAEYRDIDITNVGKILNSSYYLNFIFSLLISLVVFIFSKPFCSIVLESPDLNIGLKIGSVSIFFNSINLVQVSILSGFERFKELAIINIIRGIIFFPLLIIGTLLGRLNGSLIAYSLVVLVIFIVYQYFIQKLCREKNIKLNYGITSSFAKQLLNLSIPTFLSGSITTIMMWLSNTLLVRTPNGYSEMGLFNAVLQWRTILIYIPNILGQVMLPILSNLLGIRNINAYIKTCINNSLIVTFFSLLLGVPIIIFSNTIMKFYGESFIVGSYSLRVIILSTIIYSFGSILGLIISSTGKMWIGLIINIIWALSFILFLYQGKPITSNSLSTTYLYSYLVHFFSILIISYILVKSILTHRD